MGPAIRVCRDPRLIQVDETDSLLAERGSVSSQVRQTVKSARAKCEKPTAQVILPAKKKVKGAASYKDP